MNHFSGADAMSALLIYLLLGACAGVLAGLLGIGGGLVLVGALAWLLPMQGVPADAAMHVALASSLASIVLTAAASARAHHRRGSVLWPTVAWMVPGVLLGGALGSRFAIALDDDVLRWCVAGYCFVIAAQMLWSKTPADSGMVVAPRGPGYTLAGSGIGIVSAIVGIGATGDVGQRDRFGRLRLGGRQQRGDVLRLRGIGHRQHQAGKAGQQHAHDGRSRNGATTRV